MTHPRSTRMITLRDLQSDVDPLHTGLQCTVQLLRVIKKRQKSEPAKGDSDHAIQIRCGWRASMNPCSGIPSPEGDSQPLEELTRRLWGRDPKALAYEAAYAGDGENVLRSVRASKFKFQVVCACAVELTGLNSRGVFIIFACEVHQCAWARPYVGVANGFRVYSS